ncbi:unnamed protein product [Arabidopsis arenosa]|uniref:Transposase-associated domain-containing protein n=1 Tax=Arabidopsis arenosa TaxID=38785 RepID=A0A8S2ATI0_ARAAE|nr:unnamed protein product [Arabidopsis arenosa]
MSSPYPYDYFRSWMDKPRYNPETGKLTEEFKEGLRQFMLFASNQDITLQTGIMLCPCPNCRNYRNLEVALVKKHLFKNGFMPGYKIWYSHGESESMLDYGSTSQHYLPDSVEEPSTEVDVGTFQMVNDAFRENAPSFAQDEDRVEEPNIEARRFFDMLDAANMSLYDGCKKGHSPLSAATRLMGIKTDWNLAEGCVDAITDFVKEILPEDNLSPASYYEVQKLVAGLGLPYQVIDVCSDNCMIYWREDEGRTSCRFCRKPRYQDTSGRVPIPYKRMWIYLGQVRFEYPNMSEDDIQKLKQTEFCHWLKFYVTTMSSRGQSIPTWLVEFVNGPLYVAEAYPMYCTRGYAFKILRPKKIRPTWLQVMEETHTSKKTGQIQDLINEERIERIKLRKVDRQTQLSQDGSTSSTDIPREEINRLCIEEIPLIKGRRPGLGSLVSKDGSVSSVFPRDNKLVQQVEDLNRVIKEKDAVVEELKQQNVEIKEQFAVTQVTLTNLQTFLASQFPGQFPPP